MKLTTEQNRIIGIYLNIVRENKRKPTYQDLLAFGITRHKVRHHFKNIADLKNQAKHKDPESFAHVIDEDLFCPKIFNELKSETKKYKRFVITTAVVGCSVHEGFLKNIDAYCEANNAMLLILPAADPAADAAWEMDPILKDRYIVFDDLSLNKNLFISSIKLSAKHIDPITSLGRIGQRNGSFIYASPKQRLKMVPTAEDKLPVAIMTTGAITKAAYKTSRYMSERTAYIADHDHVMGALIIEIEDNKKYHYRQIQANKAGDFVDLSTKYEDEDSSHDRLLALIMGDFHSGETDPEVDKVSIEILKEHKPRYLIWHDAFNGISINHHEYKNKLTRARRAIIGKLSLEEEIQGLANDINRYTPLVDELVLVKSNHDEFLERYLEEFMFRDDPQNVKIALELAWMMVCGFDPLKHAVERLLNEPKKVRWLKRKESFKLAGIECGSHGDMGAHGSAGSLAHMENAYGASNSGHAHAPEIFRQCFRVGTSSILNPEFTEGSLSGWMHTHLLQYSNGSRQLINIINGKYRLGKIK